MAGIKKGKQPLSLKMTRPYYAIQGDGFTMGKPAVYIPLSRCNLNCNKETGMWDCETYSKWTHGYYETITKVVERIDAITPKNKENISVVLSGGEPLLQQKALRVFLNALKGRYYVECDTNGTIEPYLISDLVDQFNVSPKIPSSGNGYGTFYNAKAMDYLVKECNSHFIFVVARELDIDDIYNFYGKHLSLMGKSRIWLMPAGTTHEEIIKTAPTVVELCLRHGFNFSSRIHKNIFKDGTMGIYPSWSNDRGLLKPR